MLPTLLTRNFTEMGVYSSLRCVKSRELANEFSHPLSHVSFPRLSNAGLLSQRDETSGGKLNFRFNCELKRIRNRNRD